MTYIDIVLAFHILAYAAIAIFFVLSSVNEYNKYRRNKELEASKKRIENSAKELFKAIEVHIEQEESKAAKKKAAPKKKTTPRRKS